MQKTFFSYAALLFIVMLSCKKKVVVRQTVITVDIRDQYCGIYNMHFHTIIKEYKGTTVTINLDTIYNSKLVAGYKKNDIRIVGHGNNGFAVPAISFYNHP